MRDKLKEKATGCKFVCECNRMNSYIYLIFGDGANYAFQNQHCLQDFVSLSLFNSINLNYLVSIIINIIRLLNFVEIQMSVTVVTFK